MLLRGLPEKKMIPSLICEPVNGLLQVNRASIETRSIDFLEESEV
jgi:hypothetical protein